MFVLATGNTIAASASAAAVVTMTIMGMELNGTTEVYKVLYQGQPTTVATVYTAPASNSVFVKSIMVVNNDTVARTCQLFINGTAAANAVSGLISLQASGGFAIYGDRGWTVYSPAGVALGGAGGSLLRVTNILQGTTTYTPGAGTRCLYVEAVGAGGGGGGVANAATNSGAAGGGGAGGFSALYTTIIKAYTVQVGDGGAGGTAGANNGTGGTDTTFDTGPSVCTAKGGAGGIADTIAVIHVGGLGGAGGLATGGLGDIKSDGGYGGTGLALAAAQAVSGKGGDSYFGAGAPSHKTTAPGTAATVYGGGGAGACAISGGASQAGGLGGDGLIRVWEFA